ncbi:hypothetical protein DL546_002783 [Coniochaeta pulveracea]|uniref:Cytochrome P450 n=1 Tax=Coniochaeta pulveracea TaxID=177199 RepID=A0A420YIR9_9PEZI|nr:hypothetical protein DL546_002783 [Coniochaeta pulveracea]
MHHQPVTVWPVIAGITVLIVSLAHLFLRKERRERPWDDFALVSVRDETAQRSFALHGRETLAKGLKECSGPFQVMTGSGPVIVLPNRFADEIKNDPGLEFNKGIKQDFFPDYPGFEAFREGLEPDSVSMEAIHKKLTPSLGLVTDDLVEETTAALHDIYGEDDHWQTISIKNSTLDLVARTSSRVFLGEDLCRDEQWIKIAKGYTINAFTGAFKLRLVPALLRPLWQWFIPELKALRNVVGNARRLIETEVVKQAAVVEEALRAGRKPPKLVNTLRWMYELAGGRRVDYTGAQLAFTIVAMGAQSALHAQAIINICERPELLQELREEIISVIGERGWKNASLHRLELMDSYIKEIQRLHPANVGKL